eukprot:6065288-Prymnesium_polylepis.1
MPLACASTRASSSHLRAPRRAAPPRLASVRPRCGRFGRARRTAAKSARHTRGRAIRAACRRRCAPTAP